MHIKWSALIGTAGVSFTVTVAVVAAFALGVRALSHREAALAAAGQGGPGRANLALAGAVACFAGCAAAVLYGLSLIAG